MRGLQRRHGGCQGRYQSLVICSILIGFVGAGVLAAEAPPVRFHSDVDELPGFAVEAWRATVLLKTRYWQGGSPRPELATGSGVILGFDPRDRALWIATGAHVVPCESACVVRVELPRAGSAGRRNSARARVHWQDRDRDLALLRAVAPRGVEFAVARPVAASAGARVLALGFPDLSLAPAAARLVVAGRRPKCFSEGHLIEPAFWSADDPVRPEVRAYASAVTTGRLHAAGARVHSAALLPGASGGPLIDAQGRVLGLHAGSLARRDGAGCVRGPKGACLHLAVDLTPVLEVLEELRGL